MSAAFNLKSNGHGQCIQHLVTSALKFISLNSIVLTLLLTLFQFYLIVNRFRLLRDLSANNVHSFAAFLSSEASLLYQQTLTKSIVINTCLLTLSLLFSLAYGLVNALRLGIYAHDNFKLGKSFDKQQQQQSRSIISKNFQKTQKTDSLITTVSDGIITSSNNDALSSASSQSSDDLTHSSTNNSKQPLTAKSPLSNAFSLPANCLAASQFWHRLPPLGACFHLASALFLLIAETQINSKRIQLGQKPIGDIFATKIDFFIGEPISRLKSFNTYSSFSSVGKEPLETPTGSNGGGGGGRSLDYFLNDVIHSKDDFSVFSSSSNIGRMATDETSRVNPNASPFLLFLFNSKNTISLSYLNLLISLAILSVKVSQTFWYTSYAYTILIFGFNLLVAFLISVSYCSFEVLFKANSLKKIAKHFLLFSSVEAAEDDDLRRANNDYFNLLSSQINFAGNYGHDTGKFKAFKNNSLSSRF